ncbi:5'-nucleotidase C-terminal domain-containing protein [Gramella lutea]|uniref:5'-nucleotidase C-terminal domain-containing protein n=1 Tax=Christiangramia lutea TaxID=1607951 RepID=A0A9X1V4N9_9FLAO|nr:5'-nucleotidase [Christiangramia lutea]MCH4824190.1 5'-nucleotidase C-terminal domain-containing protein [Christiangramia lutea]
MKFKFLITLLSPLLICCKGTEKNSRNVAEISSERISINSEIIADQEIDEFIKPYQKHLNATLDSVLAYNPTLLSKNDGDLNTAIGNLMADVVMQQASPVIEKRSGRKIDIVLLNHGGIRSELPSGDITTRSAYNLMPFENEIVVAELTGAQLKEMLKYLEKAKTAHPISGIKIKANRDYKIREATIKGEKIDKNETYFVATSDYLFNGGDNMNFFRDPVNVYAADYKIRNALIDHFTKTDTIRAKIDDRYIRE